MVVVALIERKFVMVEEAPLTRIEMSDVVGVNTLALAPVSSHDLPKVVPVPLTLQIDPLTPTTP